MPTPIHRNDARRIAFGAVTLAALVVVAVVGGIVQRGGALPGKSYTYVTADFVDVGTLKPGKEVRQNGVRIGQVTKVEYTPERTARVTMRLEGHREVRQDATAAIGNVSALGKKYVTLDPGTKQAGAMGEGEVIPVERTRRSQALEDIVADLDKPSLLALNGALGTLSDGLAGHSVDLNSVVAASPRLAADFEQIMKAASSDRADLTGLLGRADVLVSRFRGREDQLRAMLRNTNVTLEALGVESGRPVADTVAALPASLTQTRRALDTLYKPLGDAAVAARTLQPGGAALGTATPALRSFLRTSVKPLDKVPGIAKLATPAVRDLTVTVRDARPLAPRLERALGSLAELLGAFAPYSGDAGRFFSQHALLSGTLQGTDDKHYFAALLTAPGAFSLAGVPDPLYRSEPYPKPGTAWNHSTVTDNRGGGQ